VCYILYTNSLLTAKRGGVVELLHLLVADYANLTGDGKLNVMGIFNIINAPSFPAKHSEMYLISKLYASPAEYGQTRKLTIKLLNEDGTQEVVNFSHDFVVPTGSGGKRVETNHIVRLTDIIFPNAGSYQFSVLVDNDLKGTMAVELVKR